MLITKTEVQTVEAKVVDDILCNACGKSCRVQLALPLLDFEFARVEASWGYTSGRDMQDHQAHICVHCYNNWIKTWKIEPTIE